jgi:hypothetical protein
MVLIGQDAQICQNESVAPTEFVDFAKFRWPVFRDPGAVCLFVLIFFTSAELFRSFRDQGQSVELDAYLHYESMSGIGLARYC